MPWCYRPALDGLRSLAVYLVLLFHAGLTAVEGGFIGVDLFFVLSGFLVSNVILSEIDQTGRLDIGRFYARRVRRLLPAALVVIIAAAAAFLLAVPLVRRLPLIVDAQSALLYVANWNFLLKQEDYFATEVTESPFLHFWSLAIEEQFYLVYPVLLLFLIRAGRRRAWLLPAVLGGLFVLSLGAQILWAGVNASWAYFGTDARLYQLLAGALLALALRRRHDARPFAGLANVIAASGLIGMLALGSNLVELSPSTRGILATVASVLLVGSVMVSDTGLLAAMLSRRTPVYLGQISYGTYLWHWPLILLLEEILDVQPLTLAVIAVVLSTGLAALSFQILEHPIRSARALHGFRWRTVAAGVSASALVAVTVVPVVLHSERRPRLATRSIPAAASVTTAVSGQVSLDDRNAAVPSDLDWAALTAPTRDLPTCTQHAPTDCVLVRGEGPHLTLVGDSHAKVLVDMFEQLARERGFTFSVNVVPGCPWQADVVDKKLSRSRTENCREARRPWYDQVLPLLDPDMVVFSGFSRDEVGLWQGRLVREEGSEEKLAELLFETTRETVELVAAQGRRVLMLSSMPTMRGEDPLECLATARRVHECEFDLPKPAASDYYNRVVAALNDQVYAADIGDAFCIGAPQCLPIVDGVVVWYDALHFSTDIAVHERDEVWRRIKDTGVLDGL